MGGKEEQAVGLESFLSSYMSQGMGMPRGGIPGKPHGSLPYAMLNAHAGHAHMDYVRASPPGMPGLSMGASRSYSDGMPVEDSEPPVKRVRGLGRQESDTSSQAQQLRAQHLQDKNRKAQRRFRERQKAKVSELLEQVDNLTASLETLEGEKAALTNQGSVLEKVLAMKEEQIQTLGARIKGLESEGADKAAQDVLMVTDAEGEEVSITHKDMLENLRDVWTGYVNKLACSLVEGGSNDPSPEVIECIDSVVCNACNTSKAAIRYDPLVAKQWFLSSMEDDESSNAEELPQTPWRSMVRSMALTAQQRDEICELWKMHTSRLEGLLGDISSLPALETKFNPEDLQGRQLASSFLVNSKASDQLKAAISEQSSLQAELESMLFKGILTRLQMARMMVQSYPLVPDGIGLVNYVYKQEHEQ